MIRIILLLCIFASMHTGVWAQEDAPFNVYNPAENATAAIKKAVAKAARENKHVLVQIGGNWCVWCAKFSAFIKKESAIDTVLHTSFVLYHLNYSKENKNLDLLARYSFPQRFGFPVFLVLDGKGKLLHTQNSAYLEEGNGYSKEKVMDFLQSWTPNAIHPKTYKSQ